MAAVEIEEAGDCTWLRLAGGASNALTVGAVAELAGAFDRAVVLGKGVVLCGGERFFCNGLDLAWALTRSHGEMRVMFLDLGELVLKMLECPVPVVAAIKGHAIGAGKTLFTACDYRFAATGRVLIGMPEIQLGVPNPYFADQLVRHIAGDVVANDLVYGGRLIEAERCVASGIVHQVFDREAVEEEGRKKTIELAALPRAAFIGSKTMRVESLCRRIREGVAGYTDQLLETWFGAEAQALLQAAAQRLR